VDSNFVSSVGPFVDRFEEAFAKYVGARFAVATCNGTAAIHLALRLAGVGHGDEVLVSTLTFIASVNPIHYLGATPVFVDAERSTWNLDPGLLVAEVRRRARVGRLPKAILAVHLYGQPASLAPILDVASEHGIPVIEDAAESLGATLHGKQVGIFGSTGCFSFNGNKVITCGGGGMIVTDNSELAARARHLTTQAKMPGAEYRHDEVGYNYRLTNLQAAVGLAQLEQLEAFLEQKRQIASRYDRALQALPGVTLLEQAAGSRSSRWMYTLLVASGDAGAGRQRVLSALDEAGIQARPIWTPIHTMRMYAGCPRVGGVVAEELFRDGLCLPSSVGLTEMDQQRVIDCVQHSVAQRVSA
jgi:aminotransferase in exopolysaccharide biosynthesis